MKKYLDYILLGCATLLSGLVLAFMALPAYVLKGSNVTIKSSSLYEYMSESGLIVVAFIFALVVFLVAACLCVFLVLGKLDKVPQFHFIALCAALFALLGGIFFFIVPGQLWDGSKAGAGSVLSALCLIFSACGLGCFGVLKLLKK